MTLFQVGVITAIVIGYLGPVQGYLDQRAELDHQREVLSELEVRRDRLQREIAALEQPRVIETRARGLGLIRPGERAFVIRGLPDERPDPGAGADDDPGFWNWLSDRL